MTNKISHSFINSTFLNKNVLFKSALLIAVSLLVLYSISRLIDIDTMILILKGMRIDMFLISLLLFVLISFLTSVRFSTVIRITGYNLSLLRSWSYVFAVHPIHLFIPSNAGELWKSFLLRKNINFALTTGCIFTEKLFDLVSLVMIGIVGSILSFQYNWLYTFMFFLFGITSLLIIIVVIPLNNNTKLLRKINDGRKVIGLLIQNPKIPVIMIFMSMLIWSLFIFLILLLFSSINVDVPLKTIMVVFPISIIAGLIPITVGGLGTRDSTFIFLFTIFGISKETAFIVSLSYFIVSYLLPALIGLPFTIHYILRKS